MSSPSNDKKATVMGDANNGSVIVNKFQTDKFSTTRNRTVNEPNILNTAEKGLVKEDELEAETKKATDVTTKKQPSYLHREVEVENCDEINQKELLSILHKRFVERLDRWKKLARRFQVANFFVTLLVICIQVTQAVMFQMDLFPDQTKTAVATIMPAVTSAVLAVQLKLAWTEKSMKARQSAKLYQKLNNHVEYRLFMIDAGGKFRDTEKIWNTSLLAEVEQIPAFLYLY